MAMVPQAPPHNSLQVELVLLLTVAAEACIALLLPLQLVAEPA